MRKFKPAPKQASANRIRERYLHQLGLQRGVAVSSSQQRQQHWDDHHTNHVVVISGLPSLPEDRATNDNVLESHDFSHADGGSYITHDEGSCSGGGPPQHLYQPYPPQGDSSHCSKSTLSTSPHNTNNNYLGMDGKMADESMTSMALACPHTLLKSHQVHNGTTATATFTNSNSSALPFSLSWGGQSSQLSRSAAVLLDEAGGGGGQQLPPPPPTGGGAVVPPPPLRSRSNTENSISSAATATTAESSFTATMVSRDWGSSGGGATTTTTNVVAFPQPTPSGTASVSSMGDSVTSAPVPGVFFQVQGSRVGNTNSYASTGPAHCVATSSLASALNRFNIDSDCEASIASNSIIDDPTNIIMDMTMDDSASCASHISGGSSISITSNTNTKSRPIAAASAKKKKKKKIGKNQRLLDRASAQERMIQMKRGGNHDWSSVSQKLRASMVHSQRVGCLGNGLPMPHQLGGGGGTTPAAAGAGVVVPSSPARSCCSSSVASHASSLPLMHVDHQATPMSTPVAAMNIISTNNGGSDPNNMVMMSSTAQLMSPPVLPKQPSFGGSDLGRTPTASNCSQQQHSTVTLPTGVYIGGANYCGPLNYRPQLVSKIHMPPSSAAAPNHVVMGSSSPPPSSSLPSFSHASEMEAKLATNVVTVPSMQQHSTTHQDIPTFSSPQPPVVKRAESVIEDDVMEVAVTLSMLGATTTSNGGGGMIPRVR